MTQLVIVLGCMLVRIGSTVVGRFMDLVLDGVACSSNARGGSNIGVLSDLFVCLLAGSVSTTLGLVGDPVSGIPDGIHGYCCCCSIGGGSRCSIV